MNINAVGRWIFRGFSLIPTIIQAIVAVEALVRDKGKVKEDAAVYLTRRLVLISEGLADKDLLDDEKVEEALRAIIRAVVALQNAVRSAADRQTGQDAS